MTPTNRTAHVPVTEAWMRQPAMAWARYVEGGPAAAAPGTPAPPAAPAAPNGAGGDASAQGQAGQATPPATPPAPTPNPGTDGGEAQNVADLPAWAQKLVTDLRAENAADRTNAKATAAQEARDALVHELGKALGLVEDDGDGTPPSVEDLTGQVTTARDDARTARVELAVYKAAPTHSADPTALLDSRAFLAKIADLDPTTADFDTKVADVIKAQVEANPKLKAGGQVPPRSGGEIGGRQETPAGQSPTELAALIRKNRKY